MEGMAVLLAYTYHRNDPLAPRAGQMTIMPEFQVGFVKESLKAWPNSSTQRCLFI